MGKDLAYLEERLFFRLPSLVDGSSLGSLFGLELGGSLLFIFSSVGGNLLNVTLVEESTELVFERDYERGAEDNLFNLDVAESGGSSR